MTPTGTKSRTRAYLLASLLGACAPAPARARGAAANSGVVLEPAASAKDFARALSPLGEWLALPGGVRAWRPENVAADWRPYRDGHWTPTADGWFWVSAEPWAWATYHYGRWRFDPSRGWVWLPGGAWAPARVVWRLGAGVVGWAPATDDGFVLPGHWTFLPTSALAGGDVARAALPEARVPALLARTREASSPYPPFATEN